MHVSFIYVDMFMKSEGKEIDAECDITSDCHDCAKGFHKLCSFGHCYCITGPPAKPEQNILDVKDGGI